MTPWLRAPPSLLLLLGKAGLWPGREGVRRKSILLRHGRCLPADLAPRPHPISTQAISALIKMSSSASGGSGGAGNKGSQRSITFGQAGLGSGSFLGEEPVWEAGKGPARGLGGGGRLLSVSTFPRGAAPAVRSLAWAWGARPRGCYLPPRGNECGETGGKLGLVWVKMAPWREAAGLSPSLLTCPKPGHPSRPQSEQETRPGLLRPTRPTEELRAPDHSATALHPQREVF